MSSARTHRSRSQAPNLALLFTAALCVGAVSAGAGWAPAEPSSETLLAQETPPEALPWETPADESTEDGLPSDAEEGDEEDGEEVTPFGRTQRLGEEDEATGEEAEAANANVFGRTRRYAER
jgi:hypothetical protein